MNWLHFFLSSALLSLQNNPLSQNQTKSKQYYNRQMRYQAKTNRSLSYLLKESLNANEHRVHKENKENANVINFPSLRDNLAKGAPLHHVPEQPRLEKRVRATTVVSVSSFLRKSSVPEQLKRTYTQLVMDEYFSDISSYLCSTTTKCRCQNMLLHHEITSSLRSKMIDWMIEVLSSYKMSEESFFKSIFIMDSYLKKSKAKLEVKDLHLIGISSMFLASKYEEIHPLKLDVLFDKIARKKFRKSQILQRESDIVESLSFALENASVYDISRLVSCNFFNNSEKIKVRISEKSCRYFEKIVLYLSKMVMFNSELAGMSFDLLAGGVTFIGLKTLEQADADVVAEQLLPEICRLLSLQTEEVIQVSRKVLDLAKNFSSFYPSLTNLKKFNKFQYQ